MRWKAGLKECILLGIMVAGAIFFLMEQKSVDIVVLSESVVQTGPETGREEESRGKIALTFDDGPHPSYTRPLLDGLRERKVQATFFVMGKNVEEYPELVEQMKEDGHLIGNHTYSHLQLSRSNEEQFKQELQRTSDLIQELTGETPEFVRPPFGTWEKKFEDELNMFPVLWTIDPLDWCSDNADCVSRTVIAKAQENDIILMHDQYPSSVTAALRIVDVLQEEGFEFVTVDEILFD